MVISTSFDFQTRGYAKNAYLADPDQWVDALSDARR